MSTAEVLEQLVLINETGWTIGLIGRLHTNTEFGIVEIHTVQFKETDQHMTEIGVFDRTRTAVAACRAATAAATDAVVEVVIVDITVIVAAAVIVVR